MSTSPFLYVEQTENKCRREYCYEQLEEKGEELLLWGFFCWWKQSHIESLRKKLEK